jgi:hypothetical protein
MSKKTFLKISLKEVGFLVWTDAIIVGLYFALYFYSCITAKNVVTISPQIICPLKFITDFQNFAFLFVIVLVANLMLSGIWHFMVKK